MKRSTKIILGSVLGVGLIGAVTAKQFGHCDYDRGLGHGHGEFSEMADSHRVKWMQKRISRALDLDAAQQAELIKLKTGIFESLQSLRSERPTASDIQALLNHEFDQGKAMQLVAQRSQTMQEKAPELIAVLATFYNQLNAEQQSKVSEMIADKLERRDHSWRDHGGSDDE